MVKGKQWKVLVLAQLFAFGGLQDCEIEIHIHKDCHEAS